MPIDVNENNDNHAADDLNAVRLPSGYSSLGAGLVREQEGNVLHEIWARMRSDHNANAC
jgi:hypothetical protein